MKKTNKKLSLFLIFILLTGCNTPIPINSQLKSEKDEFSDDLNYSTEALTEGYLSRKFNFLLNPVNEAKLLKELEYGRVKHPYLVRDVMDANPGMLTTITLLAGVVSRREVSPVFNDFINFLDQAPNTVTTFSGTGFRGFGGENVPATEAFLDTPERIAIDKAGNIFFGDYGSRRVRKIDLNGKISTFAGGGTPPDELGDNGPATNAKLSPGGIKADNDGNIFVSDDNRIRKIDSNGIITTYAGGGNPEDGVGNDGPATEAQFGSTYSIALDNSGNLFVLDEANLRRIDKVTGIISEYVNNAASAGSDSDFVFDKSGNIFIADYGNNVINKIDTNKNISIYAGTGDDEYFGDDGPATLANLYNTWNIAFDNSGNLYMSASGHEVIRKIDKDTGIITKVAGNGITCSPSTNPCGDGGDASQASFHYPSGIVFDRFGNLYIADSKNNRIRKISK
jgi:sugar lactone lactonase YvrE